MIDDKNLKVELVWDSDQTVWMTKVEEAPGLELEGDSTHIKRTEAATSVRFCDYLIAI